MHSNRLSCIESHLGTAQKAVHGCIGESAHSVAEGRGDQVRYKRTPIKVVFRDTGAADERYGGSGDMAILEGDLLRPASGESQTVTVFMHPAGIQNLLPMPMALARLGMHVVTCASRYPNNDTCCIMEKVLQDLNACIVHLKTKYGYKKVVLGGWSGGASLSAYYQSQAERCTVTQTPAGDPVDLSSLVPADALLLLAGHSSRARIFTEWLDPAVTNESDPSSGRLSEFDVFDPKNANQPPYTKEFIERFRAAQVARNRRITGFVKEKLKELAELETREGEVGWRQGMREHGFVVHNTMADPRRLDVSLEPNGRKPCTVAALAAENHSPVGLARFCTLRSWLSQWSIDDSRADALTSLPSTTIPTLVVASGSDHLVPMSHPQAMFDAVPHQAKKLIVVPGADHYYFAKPALLRSTAARIKTWLHEVNAL